MRKCDGTLKQVTLIFIHHHQAFELHFMAIYPSQRQDLLPTLEISTHIPLSTSKFASDFGNFKSKISKNSKFRKKNPKSRICFQNFQNQKGAVNDIKGAAASLLINYQNFHFQLRIAIARGI